MLELTDIHKAYNAQSHSAVAAVDGISLSVKSGEFVAVQGPSGCGKSTLLLVAGGLLSPDKGAAVIAGQDPYQLSANARASFRAETIGFVFQQFHLVPYLSVRDNIMAPGVALSSPPAVDRAAQLMEKFGISDRSSHLPGELSTGERQRAALARALFNSPKLILADEPTGNLDPENSKIVLDHLRAFANEGGAVLMVTHEDSAAATADRTERLRDGKRELANA
ncbi:MAG: putative ABC transport system ATP-binding protein [Limisphaerales bacterium]|jgi:putative ABC transport system ATP-binding protein